MVLSGFETFRVMDSTGEAEKMLRERLAGRPSKVLTMAVAAEAAADNEVLQTLFRMVYGGIEPFRWRAAWVIEKVSVKYPSLIVGEREGLKRLAMQADVPEGVRRLLLSILSHLPDDEDLDVSFFNYLLDKMCDLRSSSGVQALAMKLACRMSHVDPILYKEFCCILRDMDVEYYSAGVKSAINGCLKCKKC